MVVPPVLFTVMVFTLVAKSYVIAVILPASTGVKISVGPKGPTA